MDLIFVEGLPLKNCVSFKPSVQFSLVQLSCSVVSDSLRPHEPHHARPSCPSPNPGVDPNPCPLSRLCHPTISSSVVPFSSCPQSFLACLLLPTFYRTFYPFPWFWWLCYWWFLNPVSPALSLSHLLSRLWARHPLANCTSGFWNLSPHPGSSFPTPILVYPQSFLGSHLFFVEQFPLDAQAQHSKGEDLWYQIEIFEWFTRYRCLCLAPRTKHSATFPSDFLHAAQNKVCCCFSLLTLTWFLISQTLPSVSYLQLLLSSPFCSLGSVSSALSFSRFC